MPGPVAGSWGPLVESWATRWLGAEPRAWQSRVWDRSLAYGHDGKLLHRIYLASTGRQQGKTFGVRGLVGWALTTDELPAWRDVVGIAHDRTQARIPYEAVSDDLVPIQAARGRNPARGGVAITRYAGIRSGTYGIRRKYRTGSREARNALRGWTIDVGLLDEVRTQVDDLTWAAFAPTMLSRPEPLAFLTSTAGNERSVLLRSLFDRGLRIIAGVEPADGFGMSWWAADDDDDPMDPAAWRKSLPSYAEGAIDDAAIRSLIATFTPEAIRAEILNLWTVATDEWLPAGVWTRQRAPQPAGPGIRRTLAVDVTPERHHATITVAIDEGDGRTWAGIVLELDAFAEGGSGALATAAVVDAVAGAVATWSPESIAWSQAGSMAPHLAAWASDHDVKAHALNGVQLRAASELYRGELVGGRLFHADDALLTANAERARPNAPIALGPWYFSTRTSRGPIDALRSSAWATFALLAPPEPAPTAPQVFV